MASLFTPKMADVRSSPAQHRRNVTAVFSFQFLVFSGTSAVSGRWVEAASGVVDSVRQTRCWGRVNTVGEACFCRGARNCRGQGSGARGQGSVTSAVGGRWVEAASGGVDSVRQTRCWGRVNTVGEACFCRGALRGRSPCTREGRRPDRPKYNNEGRNNTFARLFQGCESVAAA